MFGDEQPHQISPRTNMQRTNDHLNTMSDKYPHKEYTVEATGDGDEQPPATSKLQEYLVDDVTNTKPEILVAANLHPHTNNHSRSSSNNAHQNIIDANDLMMISVDKITHHRYVLTDDEVEQSLQELDDTVASLDGGGGCGSSSKHHRRTHTASSSTVRSSLPSGNTVTSTGCGDYDTASLTSRTCSVLTEKSHAILMHRHLIDNMETICYSNSHYHRSSSYKRTKKQSTTSGSKSIGSRNSATSRRSKISMAQQSCTSQRTNRRPRGPSLERVIFQTLLHTARSDLAGAHFITPSPTHLGENDGVTTDEAIEMVNTTTLKEEEDFSIELILKDLIQADAVLSVEVGAGSRSLDKIDSNHVCAPEGQCIKDERSSSNGSKNQLPLLPPIATEEEPESLFPTADTAVEVSCTSPVNRKATDPYFLPSQSHMQDGEWEPEFDAIEFPTAPCTKANMHDASMNTTNDTIVLSSLRPLNRGVDHAPTTTTAMIPTAAMSISPNRDPHSSNEDSPESDIFDQIEDNGYYKYHDEGSTSLLFQDDTESARNYSPTTDNTRQSRGVDPPGNVSPRETIPEVPIAQPRVKLYDTANCENAIYYEIDAFHDEIASWGFQDVTSPVGTETNHYFNSSGKLLSTDVVPITPPRKSPVQPNDVCNDFISFPTILQEEEEGYKSAVAATTTGAPPPLKNAHDGDGWTSFDANPFVFEHGSGHDQQRSFSLSPTQPQQLLNDCTTVSDHQPHRVHEILSDTTSQDNVSVSSPASVVQFIQMVDRCPSIKSDTNNKCTFETKCSF